MLTCRADVEVKAGEASVDWSKFGIGSFVTVVVHERKDYGTIVDLVDDPDVVGLIPHHQVQNCCFLYILQHNA